MHKISTRFVHAISRRQLIEKILRVDHIGELAAVRLYDGQKAVLSSKLFLAIVCFYFLYLFVDIVIRTAKVISLFAIAEPIRQMEWVLVGLFCV